MTSIYDAMPIKVLEELERIETRIPVIERRAFMLQAEAQDLRYRHDEIIKSWKAPGRVGGARQSDRRTAPAGYDRMGTAIRCRAGSRLSNEVSHDQPSRTLGVPEKTINHFWDGEKSALVAAPDEEKNHFLVQEKGGPDRDTMTPIKEPCPGWYNIDAWHYLSWQRLAHPEGSRDGPALRSRIRLAFFPPGPAAVCLSC